MNPIPHGSDFLVFLQARKSEIRMVEKHTLFFDDKQEASLRPACAVMRKT
jgi:hypothetical protein